ncbi:hypothetical protein RsoM2USA_223 [Ralstonia phage RsoM2USA]|nr:hypothetical protein RsoM2USA_223 [Ralstonia phage RsoM2USA]
MIEIKSEAEFNLLLGSNEKILVDFYANWCGPCKQLMPMVEALDVPGVTVVKVNADEQPEIVNRYGVRGLPTLKAIRNGEVSGTKTGMMTAGQLIAFVNTNFNDDQLSVDL